MHAVLTREALILDEEAVKKVRRRALSPSTSKTLLSNCTAQWAFGKLAGEQPPDPFAATDQGTAAHAVLEELFKLEPHQRTERRAINILLALQGKWQRTLYPSLANPVTRAQFQSDVMAKFAGIFEIEDPATVEVVRTEWPLMGLRVRGVPFAGFIDRTDRVTERGRTGLRVVDFKTGRVPDRSKIERYGDDHGDQVRLYAAALGTLEDVEPVVTGRLYYTRHAKSVQVAVARPRVNQTVGEFVRAWDVHNTLAESGRYPVKTGPLCGWCPLVQICPAAQDSRWNTDRTPSQTALSGTGLLEVDDATVEPASDSAPQAHCEPPVPPTDREHEQGQEGAASTDGEEHMAKQPLAEDKSWVKETVDGKLNGNAFAATAYFGMATLAFEVMSASDVPIQKVSLPAFAEALSGIVSELQDSLSGSTDFQGGTNTRLRGVLRSVLETYPAPFGQDAEAWEQWRAGTLARMRVICQTALRLHAHEGDYAFDTETLAGIAPRS